MTTGIRRSKAMPTDGPTAKFLYTIIKQLDLKSIDWSLVASQLEISNGHAARMRYSRFKQQMEGTTSTPRSSRPKKSTTKTDKAGSSSKFDFQKGAMSSTEPLVKQEPGMPPYNPATNTYIKPDPYLQTIPDLSDLPLAVLSQSQRMPAHTASPSPSHSVMPYPQMTVAPGDLTMNPRLSSISPPTPYGMEHPLHHGWGPIKYEGQDTSQLNDGVVKAEMPQSQ